MAVPMVKQVLVAAAIVAQVLGLASAASIPLRARDGGEPGLPHDPDTSPYCTWWTDYDGSQTCEEVLDFNWIDMISFRRWNPSVGSDCSGLEAGNSYCVEAFGEPPPPEEEDETTTTTISTSTTTSDTITTTPPTITEPSVTITPTTSTGNSVETPEPVHNGIVDNCNKFYLVQDGDSCASIAQKNKIRTADVVSWNGLNSHCTDLWLDTYACVGLVGGNPTATATATPTSPGNGVETPKPVHIGIVDNCNKFYMVKDGDSCASIAQKNNIRTADVVSWNGLNSRCTDLWIDTYACVGLIGGNPTVTATPTSPSNGIETPKPVHIGIVDNCNKFYMVRNSDSCASIAQKNSIRTADVVSWNGLNSRCTDLWLDTYACVGIIGGTPTVPPTTTMTTTAGNGIQTPQPTQPGIASNCDKFHFVGGSDTCAKIASANGISTAQFARWNGLNSACSNLWGSVYACVRVVGFTPTNPGNGIETPQPTQGSIVANCKKFEFVRSGDTCEVVAKRTGITVKQMTIWNPSIGSNCSKLWANAYACVGV